jgi:hypothetical protein
MRRELGRANTLSDLGRFPSNAWPTLSRIKIRNLTGEWHGSMTRTRKLFQDFDTHFKSAGAFARVCAQSSRAGDRFRLRGNAFRVVGGISACGG